MRRDTIPETPPCPQCKDNRNVVVIYRPEVYEFPYYCNACEKGFE